VTPGDVFIDGARVVEPLRRRGMSELLYLELLRRVPEVMQIRTELGGDNELVFLAKDRAARARGASRETAAMTGIEATPAYKVRARIGFGRIDRGKSNFSSNELYLTVQRDW
jgi:hypothetical protein